MTIRWLSIQVSPTHVQKTTESLIRSSLTTFDLLFALSGVVCRARELKIVVDDFLLMRRQFRGEAGFLLQGPLVGESISDLLRQQKTQDSLIRKVFYLCTSRRGTMGRIPVEIFKCQK